MCGIVAYIGPREAYPVIMKGLKRLEYRGYDSAGVALLDNEVICGFIKNRGGLPHWKKALLEKTCMQMPGSVIPDGPPMANPVTGMHIRIFLPAEGWP